MQGEKLSSRARRPYLMGKESVGDFYKSDVRFLKEIVGRESEFEKPYEDEDYRKMHFDFPWPDWPPFPPIGHMPDIPGPTPGLSLCGITCYTPLDCDEPIWCHPSIWCGIDLGCTLCHWGVEGAALGYTIHQMSEGWTWGIDVWIDSTLVESGGEALIHVQMQDPCGNLCGRDVEVTCKVCPADVVMTWDSALSAETIIQNGTAGVYVKDGLGPYTWTVAGTGFSMLHGQTDVLYNTLQADGTACGSATITVTDFCDTVVTGYVRCTTGQWVLLHQCYACNYVSACSAAGKTECDPPVDLIEDNIKWAYGYPTGYEYNNSDPDCPPTWHLGDAPCKVTSCPEDPPCGSPQACGSGTPTAGRTCYAIRYWKYEWVC